MFDSHKGALVPSSISLGLYRRAQTHFEVLLAYPVMQAKGALSDKLDCASAQAADAKARALETQEQSRAAAQTPQVTTHTSRQTSLPL